LNLTRTTQVLVLLIVAEQSAFTALEDEDALGIDVGVA
jgi:hypothetical protein